MRKARRRRPGEIGFVGILLIFALLVLYVAYRISGLAGPSSAGVFPMLAGLAMVGSAVAILRQTLRMPVEDGGGAGVIRRFVARIAPAEVAVYALIVIGFMLALQPLGFVAAAFLFLLISFLYLRRGGIVLALLLSAGSIAAILVVFRYVFRVILPEGAWL
jgi:putative tricarboxylic transport membrane protein